LRFRGRPIGLRRKRRQGQMRLMLPPMPRPLPRKLFLRRNPPAIRPPARVLQGRTREPIARFYGLSLRWLNPSPPNPQPPPPMKGPWLREENPRLLPRSPRNLCAALGKENLRPVPIAKVVKVAPIVKVVPIVKVAPVNPREETKSSRPNRPR